MTATEDLLRVARYATESEHQDDYTDADLRRLVSSLADALESYKTPADIVCAALWIAADLPHNAEKMPSDLRTTADALFGHAMVEAAINAMPSAEIHGGGRRI